MPDLTALADFQDQVPGRYVPGLMRGQLVETEHLARYLFAASLSRGKRVLDAGCGLAAGSKLMAQAGATSVAGVDIASAPLEAAATEMPPNVKLQLADVRSLPFGDESFDLVVCLEVIEHVENPDGVAAELSRVLSPTGLLLMSSPVRGVYPAGNPHHVRELTPEELNSVLAPHFKHRVLLRQDSRITSIVTGTGVASEGLQAATNARIYFGPELESDPAGYCLALASNREPPDVNDVAVVGRALQFQEWITYYDKQRRYIEDLEGRVVVSASILDEREELRLQLQRSEQALAERLDVMQTAMDGLAEQVAARQGRIDEITSSLSWRVTAPLRTVRELIVSSRGAP